MVAWEGWMVGRRTNQNAFLCPCVQSPTKRPNCSKTDHLKERNQQTQTPKDHHPPMKCVPVSKPFPETKQVVGNAANKPEHQVVGVTQENCERWEQTKWEYCTCMGRGSPGDATPPPPTNGMPGNESPGGLKVKSLSTNHANIRESHA